MYAFGQPIFDGTAAREIKYDVYSSNPVLREKKYYRCNIKNKIRAVVIAMLIFIMGFTLIYRYTMITEMNYRINIMQESYNELLDDNLKLLIDIEKRTDLDEIRIAAESRLDMRIPDEEQICYIKVESENRTVLAERYKDKDGSGYKNNNVFAFIAEKISTVLRLLY